MDRPLTSHDPQSRTWLEFGEVQRLLLEGYPGVVLGMGLDGRIRWLNPAGSTRLGYGVDELADREAIGSLISREDATRRAEDLSTELGETVSPDAAVFGARLRRGHADEHAWVLRHKDGSPLPTRLALGTLRDHHGHVTGLMAVEPWPRGGDENHLDLASHDNLTGLSTRGVLPDRAEMALQRAARQKTVAALMLVEIVGFQALCDEHGHSVGDDVLRATAGRMYFELRKTDTAVRLDHGQFAALLVDLKHPDEALAVARKIQVALSAKVNVGVAVLPVTARVGVSWFPQHGDQLLPLVQAAEAALASVGTAEGGVASAPVVDA